MSRYEATKRALEANPKRWLVTGAAGFIGSHLVETLLGLGQTVIGVDNFSTGSQSNIEQVITGVGKSKAANFTFHQLDICDAAAFGAVCPGTDVILHQAALGSVPRSIEEPHRSFASNVTGFVNVIEGARQAGVQRFVYASSSSVYGDDASAQKIEEVVGTVLSPYAATKAMDEIWAQAYARAYKLECVGLRYFNVFGPRQDPKGPYAAVVARWIEGVVSNHGCTVHGDGSTSRDFCYVENVVQANILAATQRLGSIPAVLNIACGNTTSLLELWQHIKDAVARERGDSGASLPLEFKPFRQGDIRHSLADIGRAKDILGYEPSHDVQKGLIETVRWALHKM